DGQAAALPHGAASPGIHILGRARDRPPGPRAVPALSRDGRPWRRRHPDRPLPDTPRRHPVPVPPRVLPLVALPDPRMGLERRDRLRPVCLRELPAARAGPAAFRSLATGPRRLASAIA